MFNHGIYRDVPELRITELKSLRRTIYREIYYLKDIEEKVRILNYDYYIKSSYKNSRYIEVYIEKFKEIASKNRTVDFRYLRRELERI